MHWSQADVVWTPCECEAEGWLLYHFNFYRTHKSRTQESGRAEAAAKVTQLYRSPHHCSHLGTRVQTAGTGEVWVGLDSAVRAPVSHAHDLEYPLLP